MKVPRPLKKIADPNALVPLTPDKEAWARINYVKILWDDAVEKNEILDWPFWLFEANIMKLHLTAKKIIEERVAKEQVGIKPEQRTREGIIIPGEYNA
jgi:hypothetical protein